MKIYLPANNCKEREYIIDVLFRFFLGIDYEVNYEEADCYKFVLSNGNELRIRDHFFSQYTKDLDYLSWESIPQDICYLSSDLFFVKGLPVIFGENRIELEGKNVILHSDIIASAFYMLTRWEEYVITTRDIHGRFRSQDSLASKHGFLHRPIVNEYVDLLRTIFQYLGYNGNLKERKYSIMLTHDVDAPRRWWNFAGFIKSFLSELLKKRDLLQAITILKFGFMRQDPYDTFDYLMELSEKLKLKSHFFFMSGGTSDKDNLYEIDHPFVQKLMRIIDERGHLIGFHPSYNAYNNYDQYEEELLILEEQSPQKIRTGRQHYLRFEVPRTWQIWEDNHMLWGSTMGYHDKSGFRCGVCYEFPVFNVLSRMQLALMEKPLVVMEGNFTTYQKVSPYEMKQEIIGLIKTVKRYNGEFVLLWHNSAFNRSDMIRYKHIYEDILLYSQE